MTDDKKPGDAPKDAGRQLPADKSVPRPDTRPGGPGGLERIDPDSQDNLGKKRGGG